MHQYLKYDIENNLATLNIKLKPAAKQDLIEGYFEINQKYYLKIKVQAPKIDGRANQALIDLLSKTFKIKRCNINIIHGFTSEYKSITIKNISYDYLKIVLHNYIKFKQLNIL